MTLLPVARLELLRQMDRDQGGGFSSRGHGAAI
jgi:hypothetical protein